MTTDIYHGISIPKTAADVNDFDSSYDQASLLKPSKPRFYKVSAPCGTFKTTAAIHFMAERYQHGQNVLYVAPSRQLVRQSTDGLATLKTPGDMITTDACPYGKVESTLADTLASPRKGGQIVLATWKAYSNLPYYPKNLRN
jgi:superfamily II DNA or RNA helicase